MEQRDGSGRFFEFVFINKLVINTFGIRVKVDEHGTDTLKSGFSFPFCALKFDGILMAKEDGFGTFICAR